MMSEDKVRQLLKTLQINVLSEAQFRALKESEEGVDKTAMYLTPDVEIIVPGAGPDSIVQLSPIANESYSPSGSAFGINTIAGVKGYHVINVNGMQITVDDGNFAEPDKLINNYEFGETLQLDASQHIYNKLEIISLSSNDAGQSVVGVKSLVDYSLDLSLAEDPNENYCWVVGKYRGTIFPMARAAHTEGEGTKATARAAHAEGRDTLALGNCAHAEGRETEAHYNAHAEGRKTLATSEGSHAEGRETKATGSRSHAEGYQTTSSGNSSHAEGYNSEATEEAAHAEGKSTHATAACAHAEGKETYAEAVGAHAEGYNTDASGEFAHAEGTNTTATKRGAHSEGEGSEANGEYSHAEGNHSVAEGMASHAGGLSSIARGEASFAHGNGCEAKGTYSSAFGQHVVANGDYQFAIGKFNRTTTQNNMAFIIGGGDNASSRKDITTISWAGDASFARSVISPTVKLGAHYSHSVTDTSVAMVVGNGTSSAKKNSFVVYKNGNVESVGKIDCNYLEATNASINNLEVTNIQGADSISSRYVSVEGNVSSYSAPTEEYHCTTKKYVDDKVVTANLIYHEGEGNYTCDKTSIELFRAIYDDRCTVRLYKENVGYFYPILANNDNIIFGLLGDDMVYSYISVNSDGTAYVQDSMIAYFNDSGNLISNEPVEDYEVTTKGYVDETLWVNSCIYVQEVGDELQTDAGKFDYIKERLQNGLFVYAVVEDSHNHIRQYTAIEYDAGRDAILFDGWMWRGDAFLERDAQV